MKTTREQIIPILALVLGIVHWATGQQHLIPLQQHDTLRVSDIKTTHLLFDQKIEYLDVGSPFFVADTTQQMIRLKHIGEALIDARSQITNLTVITEDGGYYSLVLGYKRFLDKMTYKVKRTEEFVDAVKNQAQKEEELTTRFNTLCAHLDRNSNNKIHIKNGKSGDIRVRVTGIFYIQEKIALRLELKNESTIDFDIDHMLFRTKLNKRVAKDFLYQERIIHPIHTCSNDFEISGKGRNEITLLFDKFMLNKKEKLALDIFESNGGRSASVEIMRDDLLKPKVL